MRQQHALDAHDALELLELVALHLEAGEDPAAQPGGPHPRDHDLIGLAVQQQELALRPALLLARDAAQQRRDLGGDRIGRGHQLEAVVRVADEGSVAPRAQVGEDVLQHPAQFLALDAGRDQLAQAVVRLQQVGHQAALLVVLLDQLDQDALAGLEFLGHRGPRIAADAFVDQRQVQQLDDQQQRQEQRDDAPLQPPQVEEVRPAHRRLSP